MSPYEFDAEIDKRHAGFLKTEYEMEQEIAAQKEKVWQME